MRKANQVCFRFKLVDSKPFCKYGLTTAFNLTQVPTNQKTVKTRPGSDFEIG